MSGRNPDRDPYRIHRLALQPLLPGAELADAAQACEKAAQIGENKFLDFLQLHGLAPMWDKMLEDEHLAAYFSEDFRKSLHQNRLHVTGAYLIHQNRLKSIKEILDRANVPHAVYKGADIRERYYNDPSLRPAADIDVLVPSGLKINAIKAFKQQGFDFYAKSDNISHETNLEKGMTSIDLHWDIMRPGRSRISMTESLLNTRRDYGTHWGMSDEASLFIMLVHPVFTKYTTTPQAALMRTVDLTQILARKEWELDKLIQLLDMAGLRTAAWITLRWLKLITNTTLGDSIIEVVKPGAVRQKYLAWWLEKNLATRLLDRPWLIQLGLTLPAHDKASDALRAVTYKREAAKSASSDLQTIEERIF